MSADMDRARELRQRVNWNSNECVEQIAEALRAERLAERDACAKIAARMAAELRVAHALTGEAQKAYHHAAIACETVEACIRTRTTLAERAAADNAVIDAIEKD